MLPSYTYRFAAFFVLIFALSACGQNYTPQKYTGFPYNNERTAGSGIEYVLANLAPPKGIEPEMISESTDDSAAEEIKMENEAPLIPSTHAEKIFKEFQGKTKAFKLEILDRPSPGFQYND